MHAHKKIILSAIFWFFYWVSSAQSKLFVAPSGNDGNPGTIQEPFATLERAMRAVRDIRTGSVTNGEPSSVNVYLRGGTYFLKEPLEFTSVDGGDSLLSIIYQSYGKEKVIVSGGMTVGHWTHVSGNTWTTRLPDPRTYGARQLFLSDARLPRGRTPGPDSLFTIAAVSGDFKRITLKEQVSLPDLKGKNAEAVILTNWNIERIIVDSIVGNEIYLKDPAAWVGHCCGLARPGMRMYLENAPEFVTKPGEWYLDPKNGDLVYEARASERPDQEHFILPVLSQCLVIKGTHSHPVWNLHFKGISFGYTEFPLPDSGYRGIQAGYYGFQYMHPPTLMEPASVDLEYAKYCSLEQCKVMHVGASAIGLGAGCSHDEVLSTEVYDAGGNGVVAGQRDGPMSYHFSDWDHDYEVPKYNSVENNYIHDCAATQFGDVGIFAAFCQHTVISHNTITRLPYTGISIGFIWDSVATSMQDCIVEHNDVHDVMELLADGGAIYTLGFQPGSILRGNLLYDIHRSPYTFGGASNNAIFFDECSRGFYVQDNISYRVKASSEIRFNRNSARDHIWGNNYFGVKPSENGFPQWIASMAGSSLVKSSAR